MSTQPMSKKIWNETEIVELQNNLINSQNNIHEKDGVLLKLMNEVGRSIQAGDWFINITDGNWFYSFQNANFQQIINAMDSDGFLSGRNAKKFPDEIASKFICELGGACLEIGQNEPGMDALISRLNKGFGAITRVNLLAGKTATICWLRDLGQKPFAENEILALNNLRPMISQSIDLELASNQVELRTSVKLIGALGLPAIVIDENRRVLAENEQFDEIRQLIVRNSSRFIILDAKADAELENALINPDVRKNGLISTFSVIAGEAPPYVARVMSLREKYSLCSRALLLMFTSLEMRQAPTECLIRSLFGMTPSEAKVARALATGKTVGEIAENSNLSPGTVRTHVRAVLEKTGSSRQVDLVALLVSLPLALGNPVMNECCKT
jgi:DNA-binding CsgD family transcriptional regulator